MSENYFITPKDVMQLFGVATYRTAQRKLQEARKRLGKRIARKNHRGECDPVTLEEFKRAFNIQ